MQLPGVHLVTLENPIRYSERQLDVACQVAQGLNRGELLLLEAPERPEREA